MNYFLNYTTLNSLLESWKAEKEQSYALDDLEGRNLQDSLPGGSWKSPKVRLHQSQSTSV